MMGKKTNIFAVILMIVTGVLAIVAFTKYKGVMYTYQPVNYMLVGAIALAILGAVLSFAAPRLASYFPICIGVLLASAAVWGTQLMVNQIGYVIAGLDGMDTIMPWVVFVACSAAGMLLSIITAFLPAGSKA